MKIKIFDKNVKLPMKSHLPDVGLDCFIPTAFTIEPLETKTIDLGFGVSIPEGTCGLIVPRSSIAQKGLIIQTAAIDPDYTSSIHLIITNCSNNTYSFDVNDRICSLVCVNVINPFLQIVDVLDSFDRNENGLGSTGR